MRSGAASGSTAVDEPRSDSEPSSASTRNTCATPPERSAATARQTFESRRCSGSGCASTSRTRLCARSRSESRSQPVVLLGARDDLRVDRGEPGDEVEVLVRERAAAQAVRQVQDAEHAVAVDQRRRDRGLDVAALAGDLVAALVGLARQQDRLAVGERAAGDAFARADPDLRDDFLLDARAPPRPAARRPRRPRAGASRGRRRSSRRRSAGSGSTARAGRRSGCTTRGSRRAPAAGRACAPRRRAERVEQLRDQRRRDLHAAVVRLGEYTAQ